MADETKITGSDSPVEDEQEAQEAQDTQRPGGEGDEKSTLTAEDARKLRSEASALRKRLKDAESKLTERETADLSEKEKTERAKDDAETKATTLEREVRELRVQVLAPEAGIQPRAVRAAYALIDWSEVSDPDDRKQVLRALKDVAKEHPYLAGGQSADGGASGGEQGAGTITDMNDLITRRARRAS